MDAEKKQEFIRRISQSNRSGLVIILYDMLYTYMEEAESEHAARNYDAFKDAVRNADQVVAELAGTLDFTYVLSGQLYPLYTFLRKSLMMSVVKNSTQGISDAKRVLMPLYTAFEKVAEQDTSEPLMRNTQQVYAGMTYGNENLIESFQEPDTPRGFFA